jgi:hypothetical protein
MNTGGSLVDARGGIVKQCGICWSSSGIPTINDNKAVAQFDSTGKSFKLTINGLKPECPYLVRAYVTTSKGTGYGNIVTIATPNLVEISTDSVKQITADSAMCGGSIVTDYGYGIIERGVCWVEVSSGHNPTISDSKASDGASKTGYYTVQLSGLKPRTSYMVSAYAVTPLGVAYANILNFNTLSK